MFESKTIDEMEIGDKASSVITLKAEHIDSFAQATGDFNPIHIDEDYASKSIFEKRVVHGVLMTGIISGILGTKLPGLGTIAREMDAKFSRPVFIG
ncbi:MAG: MaoC family dehydratase, partial [Elusimicrobia bacterium]|nr:MaoC family dehydratase [Elusimicrobiota bacterium]